MNPARLPQIFETPYYERLDRIEANHWWQRGMRAAMQALLRDDLERFRAKPARILDAGCGAGYLLEWFSALTDRDRMIGFDYALPALQFCKNRDLPHLLQADAVHPPFSSSSFDLVLCIDTLQHLSPAGADRQAVTEFARLLRPGGALYVRTNAATAHLPLQGADPDLYRRYKTEDLAGMFEQAGLTGVRATYLNCLPSIWGFIREILSPSSRAVAPQGPGLAVQEPTGSLLERTLEAVLRFEAGLIARGMHLPFGHSIGIVGRKPLTSESP